MTRDLRSKPVHVLAPARRNMPRCLSNDAPHEALVIRRRQVVPHQYIRLVALCMRDTPESEAAEINPALRRQVVLQQHVRLVPLNRRMDQHIQDDLRRKTNNPSCGVRSHCSSTCSSQPCSGGQFLVTICFVAIPQRPRSHTHNLPTMCTPLLSASACMPQSPRRWLVHKPAMLLGQPLAVDLHCTGGPQSRVSHLLLHLFWRVRMRLLHLWPGFAHCYTEIWLHDLKPETQSRV